MPKEFKDLRLNRDDIVPAVIELGVKDCVAENKPECMVLRGKWGEANLRINVFQKNGGLTTLGYSTGFDRNAFEEVADHIVASCGFKSAAARLEVSVKLSQEEKGLLTEFLLENGATRGAEEPVPAGTKQRWNGKNGDSLTVIVYDKGTVQFQGRHLHLASLVWDFLTHVLSLENVLNKQLATYNVPVTVADIRTELETRIPVAYHSLADEIRKLLSSALAMSKVGIELEDYSGIAFPAVRALEGFLYKELRQAGLNPTEKGGFGDYFEISGALYSVRAPYSGYLSGDRGKLITAAYQVYHSQRHGLAHMSVLLVGTRMLSTMQEAVSVINLSLSAIEKYYSKVL